MKQRYIDGSITDKELSPLVDLSKTAEVMAGHESESAPPVVTESLDPFAFLGTDEERGIALHANPIIYECCVPYFAIDYDGDAMLIYWPFIIKARSSSSRKRKLRNKKFIRKYKKRLIQRIKYYKKPKKTSNFIFTNGIIIHRSPYKNRKARISEAKKEKQKRKETKEQYLKTPYLTDLNKGVMQLSPNTELHIQILIDSNLPRIF